MLHYQDYVRVLDHKGVLHLANLTAMLGECLCGLPPAGCHLEDPVGLTFMPGAQVTGYDLVCPICNYRM